MSNGNISSVKLGGGGTRPWQMGLGNLLKALAIRRSYLEKKRRREEEAKAAAEERPADEEPMPDNGEQAPKPTATSLAWTSGILPAMGSMGTMPGPVTALAPLAGLGAGAMMRGPLEQMLRGRSAQPSVPGQPPAGAGGVRPDLLASLLRDPRLVAPLVGGLGGQASGAYLPLLLRALGGLPAGLGRIGGPRPGGRPPYPPYTLMA